MTHSRHTSLVTALPLLAAAAFASWGCLSPAHDLGDTPDPPTAPLPSAPPAPPTQAQFGSDFEGVWLGEAEDPLAVGEQAVYHFPSGSTQIRLAFHQDLASTIVFGAGPALPPPDPSVGYPPDAGSYLIESGPLQPWEGFPYPVWSPGFNLRDLYALDPDTLFNPSDSLTRENALIDEGRVIDGMLTLTYDIEELFRPWCELQPQDGYCGQEALSSGASFSKDSDGCLDPVNDERMDCGRAYLCFYHCSAVYELDRELPRLTLRLTSDGMVGVFSQQAAFSNARGFLTPLGPVRFRRADAE